VKTHSTVAWLLIATLGILSCHVGRAAEPAKRLRAGLIGLDTSHVIAFTKLLNDPKATGELAEMSIVAGYPGGSPDMPESWNRVKGYTEQLRGMGVEIVDSIEELLKRVDVVLLTSVDGRPHLAQARPVIAAGKPLFIDKPMADSLADAIQIFRLAKEHGVPCFSASSLRFNSASEAVRDGSAGFGDIRSCTAWSTAGGGNPNQPEPFWFHGIHGVELLFTVMGPGCKTVTRVAPDKVVGLWQDSRLGVMLANTNYGAVAVGTKKSGEAGKNEGYAPLMIEVVRFFKTGKPPVSPDETLEILAFMDAADQSQRENGAPVSIDSVMKKAEGQIAKQPLAPK
jgi:predicted dehydrogenase